MRSLSGLVIFTVFVWFLGFYGCSVFQKSQTPPLTKQTDNISQIVSSIIELSEDSSVLILGEYQGNPESQKLTVALVKGLIHRENKFFFGLEIPSTSQNDLEKILVGEEPVCEEFISPIVDHPAYKEMLRELGMLQAKGVPLHIRAIDAPPSVQDRDGTMCRNVLVALDSGQYDRLVILVGNIHGIKHIVWAPEVSHNHQYLTGRLIQEGVKHRPHGEDWEDIEQAISFDRTPCNYGGFRTWFLCPRCWERVAVFYGAGKYFLCRHCYDLTYASQQENRADRLMRKARKIRERLGVGDALSEPILFKPKNMHQKTFDRLREEAEQAGNLGRIVASQKFGPGII